MTDAWTCRHFSLGKPDGDGSGDLPPLLRRLADEIESRGIESSDLLDVTIADEVEADGSSWTATVYWSPEEGAAEEQPSGADRATAAADRPSFFDWRPRLAEAARTTEGIRLLRRIEGADVIYGYVIGVGAEWLLLAELEGTWLDGFVAVRVDDIARVQPLPVADFHRRVLEARGTWPPPRQPAIALDHAATLIASVRSEFPVLTVHVERDDPDVCFVGSSQEAGRNSLILQEVQTDGTWDGAVSEWAHKDVTRVEFGTRYEADLLLVAGPAPSLTPD